MVLIKQSESICNYSNHGHIMEKTYTRTLSFDSFVISLWIFFSLHSVFMSSSNCGFNTAVYLGTKSDDTFSLLQKPVRLWPKLNVPHAHVSPTCADTLRQIRCSYWFTVDDVHQVKIPPQRAKVAGEALIIDYWMKGNKTQQWAEYNHLLT